MKLVVSGFFVFFGLGSTLLEITCHGWAHLFFIFMPLVFVVFGVYAYKAWK